MPSLLASHRKITSPDILTSLSFNRPLVFTNGVFDILHRGHVTCLEEAKSLGRELIVGVNSDSSTKRLNKAPGRPINPLSDRMSLLAALEAVDLVTWFEEDNPLNLIKLCKPDILVKGGDWTVKQIVGADIVHSYGGRVVSIPFKFERSTTKLIDAIKNN